MSDKPYLKKCSNHYPPQLTGEDVMKKLSEPQLRALFKSLPQRNFLVTTAQARPNTLWSLEVRGYLHYVGEAREFLRDGGCLMSVYQLTIEGYRLLGQEGKKQRLASLGNRS